MKGEESNSPKGQTIVMEKHTHQAHVMIGTQAYDVHDDRRMPLYLLNNILGGPGMNAKLNLALKSTMSFGWMSGVANSSWSCG